MNKFSACALCFLIVSMSAIGAEPGKHSNVASPTPTSFDHKYYEFGMNASYVRHCWKDMTDEGVMGFCRNEDKPKGTYCEDCPVSEESWQQYKKKEAARQEQERIEKKIKNNKFVSTGETVNGTEELYVNRETGQWMYVDTKTGKIRIK